MVGPEFEFTYPSKGSCLENITLCGSWSQWTQHYNLTFDGADMRVLIRDLPAGRHHFKGLRHMHR